VCVEIFVLPNVGQAPSPDNSWISMNPLENRMDQDDLELSAEADLYRVLKLPLQ
jgi:hypothetical protein